MRLRRSVPDEESCGVADVVLQLGENKIPIKAERLLGAAVRVSGNPDREQQLLQHPAERVHNEDEEKAIEALSRMQAALSSGTAPTGKWTPWSPDDLYPYDRQPYPEALTDNNHILEISAQEAANAPAYYDPAEQPYYVAQQTSASAIRDMALHKGAPTIFDNLGEPATPKKQRPHTSSSMKQHNVSRRSKTFGHGSRPRKLDLVQLFPQPRPSTGRVLSPSRLSHSPSAMTDRNDYPLPPLPGESTPRGSRRSNTTAGGSGKKKVFDEDIFDQHKLNVRRPPKGIQNWFDAYLESEDEGEENGIEEEDEEGEEQPPLPQRPQQHLQQHVLEPQPEPQELPADDILPPAYSAPLRGFSHISEKSRTRSLSVDPVCDDRQATARVSQREELHPYRDESESNSWDSIQSSHIGRLPLGAPQADAETNTLAGQSVLSLSESSYDDDEEDDDEEDEDDDDLEDGEDDGRLPSIRDSIWEDRNVTIGSASSIGVQKVKRPPRLQNMKSFGTESKESVQSARSSNGTPATQKRDRPQQTPPPAPGSDTVRTRADSDLTALRRLNGQVSSESQTTTTTTTTTSGDTAFPDASAVSPMDVAHMMAVTEEEKMLLDLMRRKRAAMQQLSFTEGYQMALKSEQQRLAKRTASAEMKALKALRRRETERRDSQMSNSAPSPTRSSSEADIRRQLSALRKEQVDESFQIERFLGFSQAHAAAAEENLQNAELRQSGELLPQTVYSPYATTPAGNSPSNTQGSLPSSEEQEALDDVKRKVKYFIAANGAVPPLHMAFKTMRRKSTRHATSMPPSPVVEEEQIPPEIPVRSPERHKRDASGSTVNELHHKFSSVSMDDEPRDKSPIYPPSRNDSVSQPTLSPISYARTQSSPVVSAPNPNSPQLASNLSPVSPFSQIIHSAATKGRQSSSSAGGCGGVYTPDTELSQSSELPQGVKRVQVQQPPRSDPRQGKTLETRTSDGSLVSITSAGEDVLAAWAELGGGRDLLRTKRKEGK